MLYFGILPIRCVEYNDEFIPSPKNKGGKLVNLKKMWKQTNRGILVGGVLIIGIAAYTLIDNVIFQKEAPSIEGRFRDYANEFLALNVDDEAYVSSGFKWTDELKEKKENAYMSTIDKYWTAKEYATMEGFNNHTKDDMMRTMYDTYIVEQYPNAYISNVTVNIDDVKIRKSGPNGAALTCEAVTELSFYRPRTIFMLDGYYAFPEDYTWGLEENGNKENVKDQKEKTVKLSSSYEIYYLRVNGEWMISSTSNNGLEIESPMN